LQNHYWYMIPRLGASELLHSAAFWRIQVTSRIRLALPTVEVQVPSGAAATVAGQHLAELDLPVLRRTCQCRDPKFEPIDIAVGQRRAAGHVGMPMCRGCNMQASRSTPPSTRQVVRHESGARRRECTDSRRECTDSLRACQVVSACNREVTLPAQSSTKRSSLSVLYRRQQLPCLAMERVCISELRTNAQSDLGEGCSAVS
jgi:hypothetical protein